jgi:hypothetical protein
MIDPTHETLIPRHKENKVAQSVGDLVVVACYEELIGIILYVFTIVLLNDLHGIDALPPFTVNNVPIIRWIAITLIVLGIIQFAYSIAFNWLYGYKWCRILGIVLGALSLPIIPTGSFFGMLFIADLKKIRDAKNPLAVEIPKYDKNEIGIQIKTNAILMSHLPLILYYLYRYLLTIQTDILYPNFRMGVIESLKVFAFVYGGIYILQLLVGLIFRFYGEKNWEQIILFIFSVFNILCLGIVIQTYVWLNWATLEFSGIMFIIGNMFWVLGIILNPIGVFFSVHLIRLLKQSRTFHKEHPPKKKIRAN